MNLLDRITDAVWGSSLFGRVALGEAKTRVWAVKPGESEAEVEAKADADYLRWLNGYSAPEDGRGDGGPDIELEEWDLPEGYIEESYEGGMPGGDDDQALFKKHGDKLDSWGKKFFPDVYARHKAKDIPMSASQGRLYWVFYNKMMGAAAAAAAKAGGEPGPPDEAEKLEAGGLTPTTAELIVRARNAMRADLVSGMEPHERRDLISMEKRVFEDGGFRSKKARDYFAKLVANAEKAVPDVGVEGLKLKFPPSKYQQAIFDWVKAAAKKPEAALVVDAKAGSGKTATIQAALALIPPDQEVVFLAFNKTIATALGAKTKNIPNVLASTTSSFGWAACRKAYPNVKLDEKKVYKIINAVVSDKRVNKRYSSDLNNLIDKRKMLLTEDENGDPVLPSWKEVAKKFKIDIPAKAKQTKTDVKQGIVSGPMFEQMLDDIWAENLADTKTMNFADQVFFPALHNLPFADKRQGLKTFTPDWVMIDEAQDLSPTERLLVQRISPRTVIVGDPNQSIYAFKGADPDSMDKMRQKLGADEKPLSICYRCPTKVIEEAQRLVPSIEAAPNAKEGSIRHIAHEDLLSFLKPEDHVLCRTTAPLVSACLHAIAKGRKASVMGRDIGESLANLVIKVAGKKGKDMPLTEFRKKLDAWQKKEIKRLEKQDKEHLIEGINDKYDSMIAVMDVEGVETPGDLTDKIDKVFSDNAPGIVFSTVHKAKGLEAPDVFIIRPDLMPHPTAMKKGTEADQLQEKNIEYVAITRAQNSLTWVAPPEKKGEEGGSSGSWQSAAAPPKAVKKAPAKPKPPMSEKDKLARAKKIAKLFGVDPDADDDWESVEHHQPSLFERISGAPVRLKRRPLVLA